MSSFLRSFNWNTINFICHDYVMETIECRLKQIGRRQSFPNKVEQRTAWRRQVDQQLRGSQDILASSSLSNWPWSETSWELEHFISFAQWRWCVRSPSISVGPIKKILNWGKEIKNSNTITYTQNKPQNPACCEMLL